MLWRATPTVVAILVSMILAAVEISGGSATGTIAAAVLAAAVGTRRYMLNR